MGIQTTTEMNIISESMAQPCPSTLVFRQDPSRCYGALRSDYPLNGLEEMTGAIMDKFVCNECDLVTN